MNPEPAILIIDDDEIFRAAMCHLLTALGYRVFELPSGMGVRSMVEREQPVLCLIDLIMADREGLETLGELHELAHPPKLVAVSSNLQYLSMTKFLGADAILTKPVTRERLEAILKELLPG